MISAEVGSEPKAMSSTAVTEEKSLWVYACGEALLSGSKLSIVIGEAGVVKFPLWPWFFVTRVVGKLTQVSTGR